MGEPRSAVFRDERVVTLGSPSGGGGVSGPFDGLIVEDPFAVPEALLREHRRVACRTRAAADILREITGRESAVAPEPLDRCACVAADRDPRYLIFMDPTPANGVFAFARIADELGRRRPDLPILVVEREGTEATVAACGLDLRRGGNVFFMAADDDPRRYLRVAKAALLPTLRWEGRGVEAVRAMANGIAVLASDRGALPEIVGEGGSLLPLPDRLTPATAWLPTAEEVAPWVEAVVRLWDDAPHYEDQVRNAAAEARRWGRRRSEPDTRSSPLRRVGRRPTAASPPAGPRGWFWSPIWTGSSGNASNR